jgi:hypothetical protein
MREIGAYLDEVANLLWDNVSKMCPDVHLDSALFLIGKMHFT